MTLLVNHLEQIKLSAKSISDLEFPPSRPFTNSLLHNKEITALIRDPEVHETGLFSVQAFTQDEKSQHKDKTHVANHGLSYTTVRSDRQHQQESAVARVLGTEMLTRIQQSSHQTHRGRGVDIEILLQGAEKLCTAFNVPGTMNRVQTLRNKYRIISASVARLESNVSEQQSSLKKYNTGLSQDEQEQDLNRYGSQAGSKNGLDNLDLEAEEQEIQGLESKKRALEAKLAALEKDLGGLLK